MKTNLMQQFGDFDRVAALLATGQFTHVAAVHHETTTGRLNDVSRLADPITQQQWQKVTEAQDNPLLDRSVQGLYPPGSTFKMVTALAALEAGVIGRLDKVNCGGTYVLAKTKFRCWNRGGHGPCNLHRALRESCDVYFYTIARRVGITRIAEMARRLGLGQFRVRPAVGTHGHLHRRPERPGSGQRR